MVLEIDKYIEEKTNIINQRLKELIDIDKTLPQASLFEAANYSLHPGGKRLRPILIFATVDTFNGKTQSAIDIACAMELIHTYTLIHDDLPCMDDDDIRRNKPSLHKAFSEWEALLTGDYLLTFAFEVIAKSKDLTDNQKIQIITKIAKRAGAHGIVGGQYVDLSSQGKKIDWQTLKFMHIHKTASLIIACLECGGIIANANEKEITALKNFGENIGLAYQIVDDILDVTAEEKKLGKPIKSDEKKKKPTAVSVLGIKKAKELVKELYEKGIF